MLKKFDQNDLLVNRMKTHPKVEFIVNSGSSNSVYYDRTINYEDSAVPDGYIGLSTTVNNLFVDENRPPGNIFLDLQLHGLSGVVSGAAPSSFDELQGGGTWITNGDVTLADGGGEFGLVTEFSGNTGTYLERQVEKVYESESFKFAIIFKPTVDFADTGVLFDAADAAVTTRVIVNRSISNVMGLNIGIWDLDVGTPVTGQWSLAIFTIPGSGQNATVNLNGSEESTSTTSTRTGISFGHLGAFRGGSSAGEWQIARLICWIGLDTSNSEIRAWANARFGNIF